MTYHWSSRIIFWVSILAMETSCKCGMDLKGVNTARKGRSNEEK
jgi:hypothetical protein